MVTNNCSSYAQYLNSDLFIELFFKIFVFSRNRKRWGDESQLSLETSAQISIDQLPSFSLASTSSSGCRWRSPTPAAHRVFEEGCGEAQLIGNIWVIVGSTPTSSSAGWDLTVPSEVTALTSASVHACSCQRPVWLKREDRAGRSKHWMVPLLFDRSSVDSQRFSMGKKYNQLADAFGTEKRKNNVTNSNSFSEYLGCIVWDVCHNTCSLWWAALCMCFLFFHRACGECVSGCVNMPSVCVCVSVCMCVHVCVCVCVPSWVHVSVILFSQEKTWHFCTRALMQYCCVKSSDVQLI